MDSASPQRIRHHLPGTGRVTSGTGTERGQASDRIAALPVYVVRGAVFSAECNGVDDRAMVMLLRAYVPPRAAPRGMRRALTELPVAVHQLTRPKRRCPSSGLVCFSPFLLLLLLVNSSHITARNRRHHRHLRTAHPRRHFRPRSDQVDQTGHVKQSSHLLISISSTEWHTTAPSPAWSSSPSDSRSILARPIKASRPPLLLAKRGMSSSRTARQPGQFWPPFRRCVQIRRPPLSCSY